MFEPIYQIIENLISKFSWRRLFVNISVLSVIFGGILAFEAYTDYFYLRRIKTELALLNELTEISKKHTVNNNSNLHEIYKSLENKTSKTTNKPKWQILSLKPLSLKPWILKTLSGASLWILFTLLFAKGVVAGESDANAGFMGCVIFGIIFGVIGAFLPTAPWPWLNYILYPVFNFFFSVFFVLSIQRFNKK